MSCGFQPFYYSPSVKCGNVFYHSRILSSNTDFSGVQHPGDDAAPQAALPVIEHRALPRGHRREFYS